MRIDWKSLPSLSALRAFDAAAECMSFSEAARSLNVTPAAISQQVRLLEAEMGLALVRRDGRGIALTEHGALLARSLEQGFGAIVEGVGSLRDIERARGIRVTTTPLIVEEFLLSRMSEFWRNYPNIEVSLMPSNVYKDIVKEGFDLAIRGGEGRYQGLDAHHLAKTRWLAVVSPRLIHSDNVNVNDLPWIVDPNLEWETKLMGSAGVDIDKVETVNLGDPRHSLRAAREGYGATIANAFIARDDIKSGRLKAIELDNMPSVSYWAVTPPGPIRAPVAHFIDWLKTIFGDESSKFPLDSIKALKTRAAETK